MSSRSIRPGDPALAARLRREIEGEVLFDPGSRGRYATDASIYQIEPIGVVVPRTEEDARVALSIAADEGVPLLARGAGSSQCGQTVGRALVIDCSKHLDAIVSFDAAARTVTVQPGVVLDRLNAFLRPHGLWFPVDVSTSAQATIGGMAGNNSCGSRSIRYGNMVHNVRRIEALLADGSCYVFGPVAGEPAGPPGYVELVRRLRAIVAREAGEIEQRYPKLLRRVGGYNLDLLAHEPMNLAHLLVGSEGTLAYFRRIELALAPLPPHRALGVVHFDSFRRAMEATRHIVQLDPTAVELVDRTLIELARENAAFAPAVARFVRGAPEALLLVEFCGEERAGPLAALARLSQLMGDLGAPGSVVEIADARLQREVWEVRKAGLNIVMSLKGAAKPVSFIEDCAVPLEHLADYTEQLSAVFAKHGTRGTWYAHASVGCLHVRPILDLRADGALKMRAIAEEAAELVRRYKGSYSGEHGDGIVRSEWIAPFFGPRLTRAFEEVKDLLDPKGVLNPGKIVRPPRQDDRSLFRYFPGYRTIPLATALDWSEWGGFDQAVEMCNNNGHCRKFDAGLMCPSYRATRDEQHSTRGRANTLRLALSGQLGPEALGSDELYRTLELCVSCKGCRSECPTGVDMARMKIEFLHQYRRRHGLALRERLIGYLPRYAPWAARVATLANGAQALARGALGFTRERPLPRWSRSPFREPPGRVPAPAGREVVLFVDTFSRYFEPENARAAAAVLAAAGYAVRYPRLRGRPLCCGRTFLAVGAVEEAKREARRMMEALAPELARGLPVVGLEPACVLGLRDELLALHPGGEAARLARAALTFEEFLAREHEAGRLQLALRPLPQNKALLHAHCHQRAFDLVPQLRRALELVPELAIEAIESSCCGMAGAFGHEAAHYAISMKMAEQALLPALRAAPAEALVVADGTSCRQQIRHGAGREALHAARVLELALAR